MIGGQRGHGNLDGILPFGHLYEIVFSASENLKGNTFNKRRLDADPYS